MAASAIPMPMTSVSMCPASDSRASEPVANAPMTSTTMNTNRTKKAASSGPLWRAPADSDTCECEWPLPDPWSCSCSSTVLQDATTRFGPDPGRTGNQDPDRNDQANAAANTSA